MSERLRLGRHIKEQFDEILFFVLIQMLRL